MIDVSEIFGPTVQGEGSAAGQHCLFVRLAHCNLECEWCDTAYTWAFSPQKALKTESGKLYDKAEYVHPMTPEQVMLELEALWPITTQPTIVVISGGEPLMQAKKLEPLIAQLTKYDNAVHIETAGTLMPTPIVDGYLPQYNVSPKLRHSGNVLSKREKPEALKFFAGHARAWFKFVATDVSDFNEIDRIVHVYGIKRNRVMIMPEGTNADRNIATARLIADKAIRRGYGVSMRMHILLWGNERGR